MDNYDLLDLIGQGACGNVYVVKHKANKKLYALKKVQLDESRKTRTKEAVLREARILSCLKHPHIVSYHDSFFEDIHDQVYLSIIQDYCDGGTLDDRIKTAQEAKEYFPEKQIVDWFLQVAMAVRFLHMKKVLHRDLKTENVFLNKNGTICKLGDFGIAKPLKETIDVASTCVGTPCYLSPEMCQDIPYSSKADVWALGCILYETCALQPAFDANNLVSLFFKIVKAEYEAIPDIYSPELNELVAIILIKSPDDRPSAKGVLNIPFLRKALLRYIEDKEDLLEQVRLPTRQGSRPFTTPVNTRGGLEEPTNQPPQPVQAKRALSCRPSVGQTIPSTSLLTPSDKPSSKTSQRQQESGRVSTIPEETEDQLNGSIRRSTNAPDNPQEKEKGMRKVEYHSQHMDSLSLERSLLEKSIKPAAQPSNHKCTSNLEGQVLSNSLGVELRSRSPVIIEHTKLTLQLQPLEPDILTNDAQDMNIDLESSTEEKVLNEGIKNKKLASIENVNIQNRKNKQGNVSPNAERGKPIKEPVTDRPQPTTTEKQSQPVRPKTSDNRRKHGHKDNDRTTNKTTDMSRKNNANHKINNSKEKNNRGSLKLDKQKITNTNSISHKKIKPANENVRFSRVSERNNRNHHQDKNNHSPALNVSNNININSNCTKTNTKEPQDFSHKQLTSQHSKEQLLQTTVAQTFTQRPQAPPANSRREYKHPSTVNQSEKRANKNIERTHSLDYYSDDFDSEHSDVEEEIPEEIPDSGKMRKVRSNSYTSHMDVSEIPEELPGGQEATDEDLDKDPEEIEEELDVMVTVAKDACDDLDTTTIEDETIVDRSGLRSAASRIIQKHCVEALGEDNFEKLKMCCENDPHGSQTKKLERSLGKDKMDTLYLMREVVVKNNSRY